MSARTTPVIALFGSGEHTALAHGIGAEVARRGCVLLTGGGRGAPAPAVSESGLTGAEDARRDEGLVAARIGVLGRRHPDVLAQVEDEGTKLVMGLAVGDRRNYVNAHLCDAAVALDGGDGTKSEVAFCLALGRPVVLVGERWEREFPVTRSTEASRALLEAARRRVPESSGDALDGLIAEAYGRLDPDATYDVTRRSLETRPSGLVDDAVRAAEDVGLAGSFPELQDRSRAWVAETYADWLAATDRRLSSARRGSTTPDG